MPWQRLSMVVPDTRTEDLADLLSELGALSVTVSEAGDDQPLYEPGPGETPLWRRSRVTGLFEAEAELARVTDTVARQLPTPDQDWHIDTLPDQAWERVWMNDFHARRMGRRLWVCPSWEQPPEPDAVNLLMDPGLAFGSGTHPTTTLCLEWLDAHIRGGETLIDFGCGSGILALAALKLGAATAVCIDNDPQALTATTDNAERNGLAQRVQTLAPEATMPQPCGLLLANILANPLMQLAPRLSALVAPGGAIVLSGILATQADKVAACYHERFRIDPPAQRGDWVRLSGTCRD